MKRLLVLLVFLFTVFFSYTVVAQEFGSIRKNIEYSFPEKNHKAVLDPLPAGTFTIGTGGYFPTIDSAFNKLSIDGVAGEVILELTDNLYTAPTDSFGFLLNGPIPGAGPNSRVTIKPAANKNVTIEGSGQLVMSFVDASFITIDGIERIGNSTLTFHAMYNNQFIWNSCLDFFNNSDHNVVQKITFISDDYLRYGGGPGFWTKVNFTAAPDSNLIQNNFIKKAGIVIYVSSDVSSQRATGNIVRGNIIGSETDSLISWGIQVEHCQNTLIENNIVQNVKVLNTVGEQLVLGINSYSGSGDIIRNNIVHGLRSSGGYTSVGILLSGGSGSNNMVYNNMVYDIQSTSTQNNSRVAGIQMWNQTSPKIYYNTVYLTGSGANHAGSAALYIYGGFSASTGVDLKNNILVNTRDESPYFASAIYDYSASNLISDYNDLYSNNYLVRIGGTNYNTLADWQAINKDIHSITEMPNFLSPDLHIDASIATNLEKRAIPIAGIDIDFDEEIRNVNLPDIGADEFNGIIPTGALASGTYSVGTTGYFVTIQDAFNKLQTDGIDGPVTFELIDNLYTAPADTFGFLLDGPITGAGPNSRITIKPAANKNVTIEGNWRYVVTFRNVSYLTFDGISTEGSTTLTVHSLYNSQYETNRGIIFWDNADYNIAKNLTVICDDIMRDGIGIFFVSGVNSIVAPDSNLIEGNFIKKGGAAIVVGGYFSASNTRPTGNIIRGNKVGSETDSLIAWGIQLEKSQNTIVENNIVQNLTVNNGYFWENMNLGINSYWGNGDIIRNNIVHDINSNANQNSTGIQLSGDVGHVGNNNLIYNNMVFNIHSTSTQSNSRVAGIQLWRQNNPKVYYNSVYLSGTGTSHLGSGALFIWGDCANVEAKNNILVNTRDESPYYATAIYDYTASNLTSDYNDLYSANNLVRIGGSNYNTLANWQATGKDLNSINEMPNFIAPNLHIDNTVATNLESHGTPIATVTSDFDGDPRHATLPDIGADEFSGTVIPVELTAFTAEALDQKVILEWTTATELNNNGFEVQRKVAESDFATVGFVKGEGTTTNQKEYSYIDKDLVDGKYFYRLKQIDYNGAYEYSNVIEVDVRSLNDYALEQNYPNPFNPTTTIGYVLREKTIAKLILLNAIGEEVAVLVNEEQDKGFHKIDFNANTLASGVYFYRIQAGDFVQTRKMILLK